MLSGLPGDSQAPPRALALAAWPEIVGKALKEVPPDSTVVGNPGRVVRQAGARLQTLDHIHLPDPVKDVIDRMNRRISELERLSTGQAACDTCTDPQCILKGDSQ